SCPLSHVLLHILLFSFFHPPPTSLYTLSLHDALPIYVNYQRMSAHRLLQVSYGQLPVTVYRPLTESPMGAFYCCFSSQYKHALQDRKSTRLNSSHVSISYAVFCLQKKKTHSKRCACTQ